ncbi:cadherin EGF LAG seven-pass G-type receptor 2-like, partial [Clarias magur]
FVCTVMAILLQFFYMCVFSWLFLESLHVYRMLNEVRDINYGPMRFYYLIGWGVPAIITGLAVGLDPEGYGNPDFCWLSLYDTLVWSLAGPIALVVAMNLFLYILASRTSCSFKTHSSEKKEPPVCGLRTACAVLLLVTVTCLLALLSVNTDLILFHYLFAAFNCLQGPLIFFLRIVFSKEVRCAVRYCCGKKRPEQTFKTKPSVYSSSADGRVYHLSFSESSVSLNGTLQSIKSQNSYVPFILREDGGVNNSDDALNSHENKDDPESDSDSDLSEMEDDQSGSYASTHSSDSEEEDEQYTPEEWWDNHTHTGQREQECDSGGGVKPKTETLTPPEENYGKESALPLQLHNPHTQLHKGILKKKPLSPIAERNGIHRIHNQLSIIPAGSASPRGPGVSTGSSPSQGRGGGATLDRPNGAAPGARTGARDSDSSGS